MPRTSRFFARDLRSNRPDSTEVEVEPLGEGRYAVTVEGHRYELNSMALPHGAVSMLIEGHSYSVEFEERGDEIGVLCRGQVARFDLVDERRLRLRAVSLSAPSEGKQTVSAPMPGKVVKVLVKVGDRVTEGQGLVVVEAMKMENELKSPKAGRVAEVPAVEGATVENGARLVVVE